MIRSTEGGGGHDQPGEKKQHLEGKIQTEG